MHQSNWRPVFDVHPWTRARSPCYKLACESEHFPRTARQETAPFGAADRHLKMLREAFGVAVVSRNDEIHLSGDREQVGKTAAVIDQMQRKLRRQDWLSVE